MKKPTRIAPDTKARAEQLRAKLMKSFSAYRDYVNANVAPSRFRQSRWTTPAVRERDLTRFNREEVIAQARQFVETHPLAAALVLSMTDSIVGTGQRLRMRSGDRKYDKDVEGWFEDRKDRLDIRQLRSHTQLQRCWWTRKFVDGDVGVWRWEDAANRARYLNTIEAERIRQRKFDYLDQGVKYDQDGRALQFFVSPRPKDQIDWAAVMKDGVEVPADKMTLYIHNPGERVDVLRGCSGLMVNFNLLQDLVEILEAVLQKIKNEAFIALMLFTENAASGKLFGDAEESKTNEDGAKRRTRKMVPGMILDLNETGEKAEVLNGTTPNGELIPFIRFMLRQVGCVYGWPLEMTLLDVSETNFSGGRMLFELAKRRIGVEQNGLARVNADNFRWDLSAAIKVKEITPSKELIASGRHLRHEWRGCRLPYFDPAREAQATGAMLDRYMTTPQAVLADNGDMDMDDVLDAWREFMKACQTRGLPVLRGNQVAPISADEPSAKKSSKPEDEDEE